MTYNKELKGFITILVSFKSIVFCIMYGQLNI